VPREHVEFIQQQQLEWSEARVYGTHAVSRTLSIDPASGARSCVVRYDAGLHVDAEHAIQCDEEFFVLSGMLRVDDIEYGAGDYAYLPAGFPRCRVSAAGACEMLSLYEGTPAMHYGPSGEFDESALIRRVSSTRAEWGAATDPNVVGPAVERLQLRPDTPEGERTWLLRVDIGDSDRYAINGIERHPCVEEMYLLEGDIHMSTGVMQPGAYFWRPPGIAHGPTGTTRGFVALFRAKEGAFSTEWSDSDAPVPWNADYDPVLPPEHS